jgi:hypothetical protein
MFEALPELYSDTLAEDETTAVYPVPWRVAVQALSLTDEDDWPPLAAPGREQEQLP